MSPENQAYGIFLALIWINNLTLLFESCTA
jgi:hypothetical protein